jgi:hypothetical protein
MEEPGPYLLNVMVTPEENVYPMIPSGRRCERDDSASRSRWRNGGRLTAMLQLISLLVENKPGALMR